MGTLQMDLEVLILPLPAFRVWVDVTQFLCLHDYPRSKLTTNSEVGAAPLAFLAPSETYGAQGRYRTIGVMEGELTTFGKTQPVGR